MDSTGLIDTHCHLDFEAFDTDRAEVLARCRIQGISDIVIPAVSADTFERTRRCTTSTSGPKLHFALGLHPILINQHQPHHLNQLDEQLAISNNCAAVGEIGLDYFDKLLDKEKQRLFFSKQLIIANRHKLPVIIHIRKAHDDCLAILEQHPVVGGTIHAFNGSIQHAHKYIELGFALGFGGMLTYQRSRKIKQLAEQIPLDHIVLETDAPDMTVSQHRGDRNSPEYLTFVLQSLAKIKLLSLAEVAEATSRNAKRVLRI